MPGKELPPDWTREIRRVEFAVLDVLLDHAFNGPTCRPSQYVLDDAPEGEVPAGFTGQLGTQDCPNLALELNRDGEVVARQVLSLRRRDDEDEFDDLAEEELPLPGPIDLRHARPAKVCECDDPIAEDGLCHVCGHTLPHGVGAVREAA